MLIKLLSSKINITRTNCGEVEHIELAENHSSIMEKKQIGELTFYPVFVKSCKE